MLVGHVTKDGALAGPRVLEHIVDTVLYFEGDTHSSFRLVRAIKNRFGAVNEIGVFAMTEKGLKGVANPSAIFLSTHGEPVPGSCVLVTLEGTRPMLVEIQALVDAGGPSPRRLSVGLERDRLAMLLAVLHRHAGIAAFDQDVFVNAVGGVRISEPAADLAVMLAIQSSLRGKPLPRGFIAFGEVGLAGEVRPAPRGQERLREAAKLGFSIADRAEGERAEEGREGDRRPDDPRRSSASRRRSTWSGACVSRRDESDASAGCSAALFAFAAWRAYGLRAASPSRSSAIVFWLLLQFNRAVRVMRNAGAIAARPRRQRGDVPCRPARRGMTMLQIVDQDARASAARSRAATTTGAGATTAARSVVLHFERGRLVALAARAARRSADVGTDPAA